MVKKSLSKTQVIAFAIIPIVFLILIIRFIAHVTTDEGISYYTMMGKDKNIVALLEHGKVLKANVTQAYYEHWAPAGWRVEYDFYTVDPSKGNEQTYWGWTKGPKRYYANLSVGDEIDIIYDPCDPRVNAEVRTFLNDPVKRQVFKRNGKTHLLDRFKDSYKLEDYNLKRWSHETTKK